EARGHRLEAGDQAPRLAQQHLAARNRGRIVGNVLERAHEGLQRSVQPRLVVREQIVERRGEARERRRAVEARGRRAALCREEIVGDPADAGRVHARADEAVAEAVAGALAELDTLAAVARRRGVRDVVRGRGERALLGEQARETDFQYVCHAVLPALGERRLYCVGSAPPVLSAARRSGSLRYTASHFSAYSGSVA